VKPLAVHHVAINVSDVDAALDFYTRVLGLTVREDRPDFGINGAWLDAGGQQLHLVESGATPAPGQHFAVLVEDLTATVQELRDKGVEVGDPMAVGTGLQTFVSDPAGNMVELHQAGARAR
jgi:catechol 2,3-dioxygenase-like lactoylglutathione lyase family enzyme